VPLDGGENCDAARTISGISLNTREPAGSGLLRDLATIGTITAFLKGECQEARPAAAETFCPPPALMS